MTGFDTLLADVCNEEGRTDVSSVTPKYESCIKSKRTSSRLKYLDDLIKVLRRRDVIGHRNVSVLEFLLQDLGKNTLAERVKAYAKLDDCATPVCTVCGQNQQMTMELKAPQRNQSNVQEIELAFGYLCDNLGGDSWLRLVRELGIWEGNIDAIRRNCQERDKQILEALKLWKETSLDKATLENLVAALQNPNVHRQDLANDLTRGRHLK